MALPYSLKQKTVPPKKKKKIPFIFFKKEIYSIKYAPVDLSMRTEGYPAKPIYLSGSTRFLKI